MKLVITIVHDEDAFKLMDVLSEKGIGVTKLASTGGFLRTGSTTLMCAVSENRVSELTEIIENNSKSRKQITSLHAENPDDMDEGMMHPIEVTRKTVIFVLDLDEFKTV